MCCSVDQLKLSTISLFDKSYIPASIFVSRHHTCASTSHHVTSSKFTHKRMSTVRFWSGWIKTIVFALRNIILVVGCLSAPPSPKHIRLISIIFKVEAVFESPCICLIRHRLVSVKQDAAIVTAVEPATIRRYVADRIVCCP